MEESVVARVSGLHTSSAGVEPSVEGVAGVESRAVRPPGWMRESMPATAAFVDELRRVFGADQIDPSIRAGMAGVPGKFHALEAGHEIGTPMRGKACSST